MKMSKVYWVWVLTVGSVAVGLGLAAVILGEAGLGALIGFVLGGAAVAVAIVILKGWLP